MQLFYLPRRLKSKKKKITGDVKFWSEFPSFLETLATMRAQYCQDSWYSSGEFMQTMQSQWKIFLENSLPPNVHLLVPYYSVSQLKCFTSSEMSPKTAQSRKRSTSSHHCHPHPLSCPTSPSHSVSIPFCVFFIAHVTVRNYDCLP